MRAARRWFLVGIGVVLLVTTPMLVRAVPADDPDTSASRLLEEIRDSRSVPYSGYAESLGNLDIPVTDRFSGPADLFGQRTRIRTWWRGADDWRVDVIRATGETDLFRDAGGTTRWVYESGRATRMPNADVRLPNASDLVPPTLARHVLAGATAAEVTRLPAERIAGRTAPGLRLAPSDEQSAIDHVDVWADEETGLPLRVSLVGKDDVRPSLSSTFVDVSTRNPGALTTWFTPPPGVELRGDEAIDIAAAADRLAPLTPPARLAGLESRKNKPVGAVGLYGRGPTILIAVPLWGRAASPLRKQLSTTPGVQVTGAGTQLAAGPLTLLLTKPGRHGQSWLLAGTVTSKTLTDAASQLPDHPRGPR